MLRRHLHRSSVAVLLSLPTAGAHAADTVETWDTGATNVDFYLGVHGLGSSEEVLAGDIMLGVGLVPGLSAYLGTMLEACRHLADGSRSLYFGLFGTPLDTEHVDLDLFLDLSGAEAGRGAVEVIPSFELNLDASPDVATWGVYLRAGVPLHGGADSGESCSPSLEAHLALEPGAYLTVADGHQVLLETGGTVRLTEGGLGRDLDVGGLALGYNVMLSEALEVITQVAVDLPQDGEELAVGVMAGLIATMPVAGP